MRFHAEELELARAYGEHTPFPALSREQLKAILDRGRQLFKWYRAHLVLHTAINAGVLVLLFAVDYAVLLKLPAWLLGGGTAGALHMFLAALLTGGLHSWLLYSLGVFSMHEGAAHGIIFPNADPLSRVLNRAASNLCRISACEPDDYSVHHMSHHSKFGSEHDGEFLNFVVPWRYFATWLPFATVINYSDFVAHRPLTYTRSRLLSAVVSVGYHAVYGYAMTRAFGLVFTLVALVLFVPHAGFWLDRLRQYTEHNLMPLENNHGSRSFGTGFWGLLVGGGPWGSPCHWEHHLVASLPWYQQLILHRDLKRMLTPAQRRQYLLQPVIGYPRLLWRIWRESARFARTATVPRERTQSWTG